MRNETCNSKVLCCDLPLSTPPPGLKRCIRASVNAVFIFDMHRVPPQPVSKQRKFPRSNSNEALQFVFGQPCNGPVRWINNFQSRRVETEALCEKDTFGICSTISDAMLALSQCGPQHPVVAQSCPFSQTNCIASDVVNSLDELYRVGTFFQISEWDGMGMKNSMLSPNREVVPDIAADANVDSVLGDEKPTSKEVERDEDGTSAPKADASSLLSGEGHKDDGSDKEAFSSPSASDGSYRRRLISSAYA
ncbi:hypothetical protein EGR_09031 [Echinococcus granulosus]|uniref:Uncharacterized protein n=1 Tax=Echinococcus granulosus TaxID=6210 RepID=W6UCT5_ECHGR|nr:hypothetical protein EGR_09031 [Echinococcus granulosus]EUB56092.1 hypothetical protein EGR_09031 [Echinococcus granulosus]